MTEMQKAIIVALIFIALYAFNEVLIHSILYH
jgi:hypothetical protein